MTRTARSLACLTVLLAVFSVTAQAATGKAAAGCGAGAGRQVKTTNTYLVALHVGASEQMWTMAQVKAKHPKSGEVMVGGVMGSTMSMGGAARHLEVQICNRVSRKVIAGAHPTINLTDETAKTMTIHLRVAMMEGVTAGAADLHYGNNVSMISGHRCAVVVTLNGQRVAFMLTAPKSAAMN